MKDILIVDDNGQLCMTLSEILTWEGFKVRTAASGAEALKAYQEKPATLVILDVFIPGMDGMETLRRLHRMDQRVKVIGISGLRHSLSTLCLRMMGREGALATLQKPFSTEVLLRAVRKALNPAPQADL